MKKAQLTFAAALICVIVLNMGNFCFAQAPQSFKYQAVARDVSGNVLADQAVGFQISILQGSATGTSVYTETHAATTNGFGLVNLEIGNGTVVSGDFTTIDWGNDIYFTKIEMDETGGTNYLLMGTSQLLSVPYALHAKTAGTVTETDPVFGSSVASGITAGDTANWNNHTVDTDTQLDSTGIASLGFVAGTHTVDTDTQLDSAGIAALGFVTTGSSQIDSMGIANLGYVAGPHTVDTDTQLDSTGVATLGYVAGAHTVNTDTQLDSTGIAALGYAAGAHTVNTDTQLDSTGIAALGYTAGVHTVDTDTQLDSTGIATLGYVAGAHTVDTDTQLDSTGIAALGYVAGADADSTNELQTLSLSGDTIFINNGNYIVLVGLTYALPNGLFSCGDNWLDIRDGQTYATVQIGTQCWMAENLNYGNYVAVTSPQASGDKFCQNLSGTNDASCPMGGLYEWANLMQGSGTCNGTGVPPNDICVTPVQGLCPAGWHIPSHYEWTTLEKNVGSNPGAFPYDATTNGWLGTDEGFNMKVTPICGSLPCWNTPNTGATNSSGFTALPGGYSWSGSFLIAGDDGYWWSSTELSGTFAWSRSLYYTEAGSNRVDNNKLLGFSVRCVQD